MTIGEKIKKLRCEHGMTQEKLAAYLKISSQSISKWENNNAMPDISLIVPIANFFGVTTDELFDRDAANEAAEIEAYFKKSERLVNYGFLDEDLALWEEAAAKYPGSFQCLHSLAHALWRSLPYTSDPTDKDVSSAHRVIDICERILDDCTDNDIRNGAIQLLTYTYGREGYPCADEGRAVRYANMAGTMYACREELLENAYFTEENRYKGREQKHKNTLAYIDLAAINIINEDYDSAKMRIFAYETAKKLWESLLYDGNYLDHHSDLAYLHMQIAEQYASLGDKDRVIYNIEQALMHARKYDSLPTGKGSYTSIFVSSAGCEISERAGSEESYWRDEILSGEIYDFLRDDPDFIKILEPPKRTY